MERRMGWRRGKWEGMEDLVPDWESEKVATLKAVWTICDYI